MIARAAVPEEGKSHTQKRSGYHLRGVLRGKQMRWGIQSCYLVFYNISFDESRLCTNKTLFLLHTNTIGCVLVGAIRGSCVEFS